MMNDKLKLRDGHIHTPFCPHGSQDSLEQYIEEAIRQGRKEITFTEHFPMPKGVTDDLFRRECTLIEEEVELYIQAIEKVKEKYRGHITIYVGFEVDYIEDYEDEIKGALAKYATCVEDSILSVHFVKYEDAYYAIDYLPDFEALLSKVQSLEKIYELYFNTVLKSIEVDIGPYKPKRIGHCALVRIFNKKYPIDYQNENLLQTIVEAIKRQGYEVDFNMAGLNKVFCKETYPSGRLLELIQDQQISLIMGSDAHCAEKIKIDLFKF